MTNKFINWLCPEKKKRIHAVHPVKTLTSFHIYAIWSVPSLKILWIFGFSQPQHGTAHPTFFEEQDPSIRLLQRYPSTFLQMSHFMRKLMACDEHFSKIWICLCICTVPSLYNLDSLCHCSYHKLHFYMKGLLHSFWNK